MPVIYLLLLACIPLALASTANGRNLQGLGYTDKPYNGIDILLAAIEQLETQSFEAESSDTKTILLSEKGNVGSTDRDRQVKGDTDNSIREMSVSDETKRDALQNKINVGNTLSIATNSETLSSDATLPLQVKDPEIPLKLSLIHI